MIPHEEALSDVSGLDHVVREVADSDLLARLDVSHTEQLLHRVLCVMIVVTVWMTRMISSAHPGKQCCLPRTDGHSVGLEYC